LKDTSSFGFVPRTQAPDPGSWPWLSGSPRSPRRHEPAGNVVIKPSDILILQGEPAALERIVALEKLELTREGKSDEIDMPSDEIGVIEAVVTPDSQLVGSSVDQLKLFDRHAVNLLYGRD